MEWETQVSTDTDVQPEVFGNEYSDSTASVTDIGSGKRTINSEAHMAISNNRKDSAPAILTLNHIQLTVC